jgi:hypothetical protein
MRIRTYFLCTALAAVFFEAPLPTASCQVVGYATVPIAAGYNFVANPFDTGDNTLTAVVSPSYPALGTAVYLWNVTNQQYAAPSVYSANGWSTNFNVPPGTGFVISSVSSWSLTFYGNVPVGTSTTFYAGTNKFSLLASHIAISEGLAGTNMTFPGLEGENVFVYNITNRNFSDACTFYAGYGWFDPNGTFGVSGPVINIAQSFFAQNLGASTNWVQTYHDSGLMSQFGLQAGIRSIHAAAGMVVLSILNPGGTTYSIQFSADRSSWTTLAANQTGATWTGPIPSKPQGFYRVTNP